MKSAHLINAIPCHPSTPSQDSFSYLKTKCLLCNPRKQRRKEEKSKLLAHRVWEGCTLSYQSLTDPRLRMLWSIPFLSAVTLSNRATVPSVCARLEAHLPFRTNVMHFSSSCRLEKVPKKCRWEVFCL